MPTITEISQYLSAMQLATTALPLLLQDDVMDLELTDSLLFGCEDEVDEPVPAAVTAPSPCTPVRLEFLEQQTANVAEVAASVAAIRSACTDQAGVLTAEAVARQLALTYGYGDMVCLRSTSASAKLQVHQSHSFAVCKLWTGEEVLVDVGFRESIQLGCLTAEYEGLLRLVPEDFVGTQRTLNLLLRVVSDAAAAAFAAHGMLLPPWRTYSSMLHRWTSTSSHDASIEELASDGLKNVVAGQYGGVGMQRAGASLTIKPVQHAPKTVVVGFPSGCNDIQAAPAPCLALPACRAPAPPTMKHVSQQIDRLLGPIRKVKLGCM